MEEQENQNQESSTGTGEEIISSAEKSFLAKSGIFFLEIIKIVILAGITIGLVRYILFKPFYVKGQSMEPAFYEHEYLIVDELTYRFREPERGEVVVFKSSSFDGDYLLKRVIAVPGERVNLSDNKIVIYNLDHPQGIVLDETYLTENTAGSVMYTLGPDQYFLLGDNRDSSYDSRRFGPVDRDTIIGKVFFRGWPIGKFGLFSVPELNF
ncbi:MAG: signal peptidase I [Candidatus Magasanikbacteria bacterium]